MASTHGRAGPRVAVVGAGIIGLSSALRLQQTIPGVEVVVFGAELPPNTTGDGAAGLWMPVYFTDTPRERLWAWSKDTWDFLAPMVAEPTHQEKGVYYTHLFRFFSTPAPERPFWADIVATFRMLSAKEAAAMVPCARSGFMATTLMVEGESIIDFVFREVVSRGGRCIKRWIHDFEELAAEGFDLVLNCSGLGARRLCSDAQVSPIRGQILRLRAPWIRIAMFLDDDYYILPNRDKVVVGGTHQADDWDTAPRQEDSRAILDGCAKLVPSVRRAEVLGEWVGLRPGRTTIRIESERRRARDGRPYTVVHNYGHGGSGLTIFWGCAVEAVTLARAALGGPEARL